MVTVSFPDAFLIQVLQGRPQTPTENSVCWAVDGGEGKKSGSEYRNAFIVKPYWAVIPTSPPSLLKWQSGTREEKVENKEENFEDPGTSHSV